MSRIIKQGILAVVFLGVLAYVAVLGIKPAVEEALPIDEALSRHGFALREVSKKSGIDFVHHAPTLDAKLTHIMPIIASMGAAVSVVDFDHDGLLDIYVINSGEGSKNRLYRNKGDGTFEDVAEKVGLADLNQPGAGVCMGAVWGDFDNDGFEDVLIYKWGRPELYHNNGGKSFTRVTNAGLPKWVNANSSIWLDYNRDGKLDLLICGYWPDDLDLWNLKTTKVMPESFEYANNGGHKYLFRNNGDGTFTDVTKEVGIKSTRWTLAASAANLCGSGFPDIVLANDYGVSEFFANRDGKRFEEVGQLTGIGETPKSGMNVSFGDVFNQGRLSIYISNITEPTKLVQGNNLWTPEGKAATGVPRYLNQADTLKIARGGWSWSGQFGDLNNDGLLDLYLTNGYISAEPSSYWYDYSNIASSSLNGIIIDASNWPAVKGRSLSGYQTKCVWLNRRGDFLEVAQRVGVTDKFDGRAVALADLGNRGVLDVVVANQKGPLLLYRNTVAPDRNWVQFDLEGSRSNRSAIGAAVHLYWSQGGSDHEQLQEVSGGTGYAAQNMRRLHFGLGKDAVIHKAVIHWPSGTVQTLDRPAVNRCHPIKEPSE
jgi:enediyne biosynthesis protein E4